MNWFLVFVIICGVNGGVFARFYANKYYLDKQKFLLQILHRVEDPLLNVEWLNAGKSLVLDKSEYMDYNDHMINFYIQYRDGYLLPRNVHYSALAPAHAAQTLGLFYFFYHARDWEILRTNICWARIYVNPGMFVHTLIEAMSKREDFNRLKLPKIYEILPQHFFHQRFVREVERFDYGQWSRAGIHEIQRLHGRKHHEKYTKKWQWWRYMGLEAHVYKEIKKYVLPSGLAGLRNTTEWSSAMADVSILWMPVDYSRDILAQHGNTRELSYLTEDVGWNAYWYYLNMGYALVEVQQGLDFDKMRDWWFWNLQQILTRYKLERYARGLKKSLDTKLRKIDIYAPALVTYNGEQFKSDQHQYHQATLRRLSRLQGDIQRLVSEGSYQLRNGTTLPLQRSANLAHLMRELFGTDISQLYARYLHFSDVPMKPQLMNNYETMLRDPKFYIYAEELLKAYHNLRSSYHANSPNDIITPGVRLSQVDVEPLVSYNEIVDIDVSNLLNDKHFYFTGQFMWLKSMQARQQRLNHKPFKLQYNITADWPQAVVVRTFLTSIDCEGNSSSACSTGYANGLYYQLDSFVTNLAAGYNIIQRRSVDFFGTTKDHIGYTELYRYTLLGAEDKYDFPMNITTPNCALPNRLQLPRGRTKGLPMRLFFIATPYAYRAQEGVNFDCDFAEGITSYDELPFGFPFERDLEGVDLNMNNMLWKNVKIYHDSKFGKKL